MIKFFFLCLFSMLCAKDGTVLIIDEIEYSLHQFYDHTSKKQWDRADSTKRNEIFNNFVLRELCVLEAKNLGFLKDPLISVKVRDRSQQILVNESYEQFVALPLISPSDIIDARLFARNELLLNHILIGFSGAYLAEPPERSIDDALLLAQNIHKQFIGGEDFSLLAKKHSEDPSVSHNSGSLGWVRWGETVPEFQTAAFMLKLGVLSDPILTSFGYHLILAEDRRLSDYNYMSEEEFESSIVNLSKRAIRNKLRGAAITYDSLLIKESGVHFNSDAILKIAQTYNHMLKNGFEKNNVVNVLESLFDIGVVCVINGEGVGVLWFSNKIKKIPPSTRPVLDTEYNIISIFKTIILQDLALKKAYTFEVEKSFNYRKRKNNMVSGILYDAYLKHLLNSVSNPDTNDVKQYYNNNLSEKYTAPDSVFISELRVSSRNLADSLLSLIGDGESFSLLSDKHSLVSLDSGSLEKPFTRKQNRSFYDAVVSLSPGEVSPIISSSGGHFSILLLLKNISGKPFNFYKVYSRIESLLIKEAQVAIKKSGPKDLLNKYNISHHLELLY